MLQPFHVKLEVTSMCICAFSSAMQYWFCIYDDWVNFISRVSCIPTSRYSMFKIMYVVHMNEVKQTSKNAMSHFFEMSRIKIDNHSIHLVYHVPIVPLVFFEYCIKDESEIEFF